ncbi:uncharacterized protein KY384_003315 [Bacidia gigantensis]|uniref:uncharacterized protein n=1 Tax=Bacidia gigantensis TaxID=2732470 RepID=UPI001D049A66|nr:uncharacterized protein KY384_003315 [Bacidia gigantensis]KAG8531683.1 hypothetical protein KY384_003315 [Bacidia gigantensis]
MPMPTAMQEPMSEANKVANALKARKRTKTGCLTCRKRRIKCGEERPTCKNCTKSKRECEGYIPRVIFKEPAGGSGVPLQGPYYAQPGYGGVDSANFYGMASGGSADTASYPAIAPRPSFNAGHPGYGQLSNGAYWTPGDSSAFGYMNQPYSAASTAHAIPYSLPPPIDTYSTATSYAYPHVTADAGTPLPSHTSSTSNGVNSTPVQSAMPTWPYSPASTISHATQPTQTPTQSNFNQADIFQPQNPHPPLWASQQYTMEAHINHVQLSDRYLQPIQDSAQDFINDQVQFSNQTYGADVQPIAVKEEPEDDWFDVESDDETQAAKVDKEHAEIGVLLHNNASQNNGDSRSLTSYLNEPNILSTYNPAYAASPLKDPQTARIFCHFITSTGPTLHVCERHPSNPSVIFSGRPVPKPQQALWSYTLPMLALHHQGLLHAMLAISSLHIAKLQQTSPTPSLRHYHYALRRVAKALGDCKKRREPATLAATLLLGYYEVTTAEHNKWNSHLSGARELVMDIPYARMSKKVEAYRRKQDADEAEQRAVCGDTFLPDTAARKYKDICILNDKRLDKGLLSTIMGWDVRPDKAGKILNGEMGSPEPGETVSQKDVDEYETQVDLFWWYAKQDTYQSIISGNRLLLSYERWAHVPPRAPIGRPDAVHGTMDHLHLLMARLADFAGKDLSRKKRAHIEAERAAKAARNSPPSSSSTSPTRPPPMYGMIPDPGPVRVPTGFSQAEHDKLYTSPTNADSQPLDIAFAEAQTEWTSIAHAFDVLFSALGPSYEPLSAEHMTPLSTPFGPAMYYRSYGIACVLCLYYCGRIILTRVHPSMPPAAMVASGVAAPHTASYANTIGRICAGIQPVSNTAPLVPHHGAALMDVCMGLFHAGIQYRDPAQRGWMITKLRDVARLTGWQTSSLIASGCERAWMHFADLGKGPPYERTMNKGAKDDRVAGRSRDPSHLMGEPKDNNDRRFVKVNAGTRVYWAMGILSMEEDMKEMNLGE